MTDMTDMKIAAAVMAGGRSSRMAGRHKGGLLTTDGVTFTDRLAAEMHKLTDLVYISYGDTIQTEAAGCRIVRDIYKGCGPVGGLHAVLTRAAEDGAAAVAACACDMPYVTAELYRYLYAQLAEKTDIKEREDDPPESLKEKRDLVIRKKGIKERRTDPFELYDGAVAVTGGRIHPLAGVYGAGAARICKMQLEERDLRLRDALEKMRILYVELGGTVYEHMLLNINTDEDYAEYMNGVKPALQST